MIIYNCCVCKETVSYEDNHYSTDSKGRNYCDSCGSIIQIPTMFPKT